MSNELPKTGQEAVASSKLLACPFCGAVAEVDRQQAYRRMNDGKRGSAVAIYCIGCGVQMTFCREDVPEFSVDECERILTSLWNTRQANVPDQRPGAKT